MVALQLYTDMILSSEDASIKEKLGAQAPAFYERFICVYVQQLNEKIDKIREQAGRNL